MNQRNYDKSTSEKNQILNKKVDQIAEPDLFEWKVSDIDEDTKHNFKTCKFCNTINWKHRKNCLLCCKTDFRRLTINDIDTLWDEFGPNNYVIV